MYQTNSSAKSKYQKVLFGDSLKKNYKIYKLLIIYLPSLKTFRVDCTNNFQQKLFRGPTL